MKTAELVKTKNKYKIVTWYKRESGSYLASNPIYILPLSSEIDEISNKIFLALNTSKELKENEEDEYRLGNKIFLKNLKETSLTKLYRESKSCFISIDNSNLIKIIPYKESEHHRGLVEDIENSIELYYNGDNQIEIVKSAMKILE